MLTRAALGGLVVAVAVAASSAGQGASANDLRTVRNFYGILHVTEADKPGPYAKSILTHGRVLHGFQYLSADKNSWPTAYFGEGSGIDIAISNHPRRATSSPALKIGVIGLGAGTIAAYGRTGDVIRFYEINPAVEQLSRESFSFRSASQARMEMALGDARVTLNAEAPQAFDVFVVDAFSGDAIPAHLLTAECARIYQRHLKPDGILAFHISNRSLDLAPVVRGLTAQLGGVARTEVRGSHLRGISVPWLVELVQGPSDMKKGTLASTWMLISANDEFWKTPAVQQAITPARDATTLYWTDDFTSLWRIVKASAWGG